MTKSLEKMVAPFSRADWSDLAWADLQWAYAAHVAGDKRGTALIRRAVRVKREAREIVARNPGWTWEFLQACPDSIFWGGRNSPTPPRKKVAR